MSVKLHVKKGSTLASDHSFKAGIELKLMYFCYVIAESNEVVKL